MSSENVDTVILRNLVGTLRNKIQRKEIDTTSVFSIIVRSMEMLEMLKYMNGKDKKRYVLAAVTEIAKGNDGIEGTADDVIPSTMVNGLKMLLEGGFVGDIVDLIIDASRGKFDLKKVEKTVEDCSVFQSCFGAKKAPKP